MSPKLYQAYRSFRPVSNEKQWLPHTGSSIDEVGKKVRDDYSLAFQWSCIYIAEVKEVQS
jgi:hypothetical protein